MIDDLTYSKIVRFLHRLKIVHGNDFLNVSLRKHPKLYNCLLNYEKEHIIDLEREIDSIS